MSKQPLFWGPARFYRESRTFMQGYSAWHFWRKFPLAMLRFYWYELRDLPHMLKSREWAESEASE